MSTKYTSYLSDRQKIISQCNEERIGGTIILSQKEELVNNHLKSLRKQFVSDSYKNHDFPSSLPFYLVRERIESTEIYKILKKMPKGGLLHSHFLAMINTEFLISEGLSDENDIVYGKIRFFHKGMEPEGYVPTRELLESDPHFKRECRENWTMNENDFEGISGKRWEKFQSTFGYTYDLKFYGPVFRKAFMAVCKDLVEDNIQYAELNTPLGFYDLDGEYDSEKHLTEYMKLNQEFVDKNKNDWIGIRLKHEAVNQFDKETVSKIAHQSFDLQKKFENFIVGFDLVGEEDNLSAHRVFEYFEIFVNLMDDAKQQGREFKLFLHGGETLWPINNLVDLVLLGAKRIGHGLNLYKYPLIMDLVKKQDMCIEICPISNHALGLTPDLRGHPAQLYLNAGVPIVLSSDDAEILGYKGVTHDFFCAFAYWHLDLKGLKQLALNSIKYSAFEDKPALLKLWQKKYDEFIDDVASSIK